MTHVAPPRWSESEFAAQIARATEIFKNKRIDEPLELYSDLFDRYRDSVENLLEESVDLQELPPSFGSTSPIRTSATPSATSPHPPSPTTISTTSLIATSRQQTYRRNMQKADQERHSSQPRRCTE
mgnify:FL=1